MSEMVERVQAAVFEQLLTSGITEDAGSAWRSEYGAINDLTAKIARAALDALAALRPDTSDLNEMQAAHLGWPTPQLQLTDPICCFVPGRGWWIGQLGWAIAPDYMAALAENHSP